MQHTSPPATGLTAAQVEESRRLHGANLLTPPKGVSPWRKFLLKFTDPLIIILLVAGALSLGVSFYEYYVLGDGARVFFEPTGIFIAILLATGLSFYFENRAEGEFKLLNRVDDDEPVMVVRDSHVTEVPKRDIVVGDIVMLDTGNAIPADGILIKSTNMMVDESTLTGEPSAPKSADPEHGDPEATYPTNTVLRGTRIIEGHGQMEVTAVGDATESGKVHVASGIDRSVTTPLDNQLARLGSMISRISYILAALILVGRVILWFAQPVQGDILHFASYLLQSLMIAVTLIVVAVPEGLPMAVTLSLAYSMRRMLKANNLVRKIHACETMGATTVICTDKTGTLTENQMQVSHLDLFLPPGNEELFMLGIAVNSTAHLDLSSSRPTVLGNPTEGALLLMLREKGLDYELLRSSAEVLQELPFSTQRKFMATAIRHIPTGRCYLFVKGAPEIVFNQCSCFPEGVSRESLGDKLAEYQSQAMRTLGFAYQELKEGEMPIQGDTIVAPHLCFMGIAAISDPVRPSVPQAVKEVHRAGVKIIVVTGDTPRTALEVGRLAGIFDPSTDSSSAIMTGEEFARIPDAELPEVVEHLKIIARARPLDKKRLVEALQSRGEVVAVTGDGTNDAPALKAAHVGLSMGDGTSVAKQASDITILDNSFSTISSAIMWGRSLYRNIQRFILFQLTVNLVACLTVLVGAFTGIQSPLTVAQMLWVNLVMDTFAAMALASLPPSSDVMNHPPRSPKAFIIVPQMWRNIISTGLLFTLLLLLLLYYLTHASVTSLYPLGGLPVPGIADGLTPYEQTIFFTVFIFLQIWNMFNARAYDSPSSGFNLKGCRGFLFTLLLIVGGQIAIVTLGGSFFNVTPIPLSDWLVIAIATSPVIIFGELVRLLSRKHRE